MENQRVSSEGEDIPSDFFDDFNKDEFMEGLSVIDSWDDEDKKAQTSRVRINSKTFDSVRDLRELIVREDDDDRHYVKPDPKYSWQRNKPSTHKRSSNRYQHESDNLDDYIKPGSRRDPTKTNEAIKKDKEVKVKEYLAKHLESDSDLRPPGTELDDFFDEHRSVEVRKRLSETRRNAVSPPKEYKSRHARYSGESPVRRRESPPRYRRVQGKLQRTRSPHRPYRPNFAYDGPHRSIRKYHRYSPRRVSPEVRRERRSRSPYKRSRRDSRSRSPERRTERDEHRRSRSSTRKSGRDDFLYPNEYNPPPEYFNVKPETPYQVEPEPQYAKPVPVEYGDAPIYPYVQSQGYGGYGVPYEYGDPSTQQMALPPIPQPVPQPIPQPVPAPIIPSITTDPIFYNPAPSPSIMQPLHRNASPTITNQPLIQKTPEALQNSQVDALAKLVADGKLSHEDYLKLAPNKVLNRCHNAMSMLGNIVLPNQLLINNSLIGPEQKQIAPKFCSPLKRQATTEFHFTKYDASAVARQNKQIVDSIIATLGLEKIVGRKKKVQKDTKDVAVQTSKPFCDVCAIRESTTFNDAGTSIDRELFLSTVHTQVDEQDLVSSKSVFNLTGGVGAGANMSIAHMTPAQLVSQLAARAKTLKQTEPSHSSNQFRHSQNYDYDSRGSDHKYNNQYNYRY
ncbi:unnamed protein product [Euphydryas editha]|uniref:Uncharacterized protein n=1 Tax=Euphydryas editha TaxID=104508 RepID=A0AAU9TWG4_EUPED|nr:unnamed protein product [Euphydryas editha]